MLLELMSDGTLAELPPEYSGLNVPDEPSVMLLLPHNKYLLGTGSDEWIYSDLKPGAETKNVYLYDDENLSLNDENGITILPGKTVTELREKLYKRSDPPGRHVSTVLMLKTFLKYHPVFSGKYLNEAIFNEAAKNDSKLYRAYWTLRFALSRSELEATTRVKAWLAAGPENFDNPRNIAKIWFSIMPNPSKEIINDLEELNFSRQELSHMIVQNISPIVLYNPEAGWLIFARFGRNNQINETIFFAWLYLNHELWQELREVKKMSVRDIINAVWGNYDTQQAVIERAKYKGAETITA
ncbi:MAG: hypothetical protein IJT21_04530 [Synergistaceae bacterium]|nr:hypothetical protein [Synergistaceae bacterium]